MIAAIAVMIFSMNFRKRNVAALARRPLPKKLPQRNLLNNYKKEDSADVRFAMRYMGPVRQKTVNHVRWGTEQH